MQRSVRRLITVNPLNACAKPDVPARRGAARRLFCVPAGRRVESSSRMRTASWGLSGLLVLAGCHGAGDAALRDLGARLDEAADDRAVETPVTTSGAASDAGGAAAHRAARARRHGAPVEKPRLEARAGAGTATAAAPAGLAEDGVAASGEPTALYREA